MTVIWSADLDRRQEEMANAAERAAEAAAERAGLTVEMLSDLAELQAAVDLLSRIWGSEPENPPINRAVVRALAHAGNYVAGARSSGQLVATSIGFLGCHGPSIRLHSHITGVSAGAQGRRAGFALKQHQRAWALRRGITEITWTFDPLVRRNGYFNLNKLRARIVGYEPDFYGDMVDGINAGGESDRCVVIWSLTDPDVVAASWPGIAPREEDEDAQGVVILSEDDDGHPVVTAGFGPVLRAWVPEDIVAIRRDAPGLAVEWRHVSRIALGGALDSGYQATRMSRDGWYTLVERDTSHGTP